MVVVIVAILVRAGDLVGVGGSVGKHVIVIKVIYFSLGMRSP